MPLRDLLHNKSLHSRLYIYLNRMLKYCIITTDVVCGRKEYFGWSWQKESVARFPPLNKDERCNIDSICLRKSQYLLMHCANHSLVLLDQCPRITVNISNTFLCHVLTYAGPRILVAPPASYTITCLFGPFLGATGLTKSSRCSSTSQPRNTHHCSKRRAHHHPSRPIRENSCAQWRTRTAPCDAIVTRRHRNHWQIA